MVPFVFFGSSRLAVIVLDELFSRGLTPSHIVTLPDKPVGRKQVITPNIVKQWALTKNIPVLDPAKLDATFIAKLQSLTNDTGRDLFIVASYGKIIPSAVIEIPRFGTLNIHPSLLPRYRGPSPLPTSMIEDSKHTGVTIIKIDNEMDHGHIIAETTVDITEWPPYLEFEEMMAKKGAQLLADIIPGWIAGTVKEKPQDHAVATYTRKFTKADSLISLSTDADADAYTNFRKIQAFQGWLGSYFIVNHEGKEMRVIIKAASYKNSKLIIEKVVPEGDREMSYTEFEKRYR